MTLSLRGATTKGARGREEAESRARMNFVLSSCAFLENRNKKKTFCFKFYGTHQFT